MNRPTLEVADIFRARGDSFIDRNQTRISYQQLQVMRAITRCRTAALGGHVDRCTRCGHQAISFNSCRNRHCPKCQAQARQRWLADRERELLDTTYFHRVFTLPHQLSTLALQNQRVLYDLLFRTSAATVLEVAADPNISAPKSDSSASSTFTARFPPAPAALWREPSVSGRPKKLRRFPAHAVSAGLGRLRQTGVRRSNAGTSLSRAVHPSSGDLQSPAACFR